MIKKSTKWTPAEIIGVMLLLFLLAGFIGLVYDSRSQPAKNVGPVVVTKITSADVTPTSPLPTVMPTKAPVSAPQQRVTTGDTFMAVDKETLRKINPVDRIGLNNMISAHLMVVLPAGTTVQWLGFDGYQYEVRVQGGPYNAEHGYVAYYAFQ